jgi:hypothetical protein
LNVSVKLEGNCGTFCVDGCGADKIAKKLGWEQGMQNKHLVRSARLQ